MRLTLLAADEPQRTAWRDLFADGLGGFLSWLNLCGWTYNPRTAGKHHPFVTWPVQNRAAEAVWTAIDDGRDVLVDKSRDMGATWLNVAVLLWWWLFVADNWRNRLVLFGLPDRPGEYLMTRQGDPWDLDVAAGDARAAVAGELSEAAAIGDPITAVCPWGTDLLLATSRSLWRLHGDPAQGGYASQLSRHVGLLGPTAWCTGGDGRLYFLAAQGAFALDPSGRLSELSGHRVPQLADRAAVAPGRSAATGEAHVSLAYDAARNGVLVLLAERSGGLGEGWFYDVEQDAWFPDSYGEAFGPMCAAWYNATDADHRRLLLGGRNGRLYAFDDAADNDDVDGETTHAIDSSVTFAPLRPAPPAADATLSEVHATLAETGDGVAYALAVGDSAEAALAADAVVTGQWAAGANRPVRSRLRGRAFALTLTGLAAGGQWALEHLTARFHDGGPAR